MSVLFQQHQRDHVCRAVFLGRFVPVSKQIKKRKNAEERRGGRDSMQDGYCLPISRDQGRDFQCVQNNGQWHFTLVFVCVLVFKPLYLWMMERNLCSISL